MTYVCAAVTRKLLSVNFIPPAKKEHPNTSKIFERIDPINYISIVRGRFFQKFSNTYRVLYNHELVWKSH